MSASAMLLEVARALVEVLEGTRAGPAALATVIGRSGSAPQVIGARLLLLPEGQAIGTVGGGAIEEQALAACRECLRDGAPRRIEAHLVRDLGMCCGGSMEVFVELIQAEERLFLIGGGHVAQAIAPVARGVGLQVTVVDDREELLEHPAFVGASRRVYDVDELAAAIPSLGARDFVVIVSRDHQRDEVALEHLLQRPCRYLGMIGSRRKVHTIVARVLRRAAAMGRAPPDLSRLRAPVGLALGGRTPAEIAISVIAEVIAVRHGGDGQPMSVAQEAATGARGRPEPSSAP